MSSELIVELIQTLGFPIGVCIILLYDKIFQQPKRDEQYNFILIQIRETLAKQTTILNSIQRKLRK